MNSFNSSRTALMLAAACGLQSAALAQVSAGAPASYRVIDLGGNVSALAINRQGDVAGGDSAQGGVYSDGAWHHVNGYVTTAINDGGDMIGFGPYDTDKPAMTLWLSSGEGVPIAVPGPSLNGILRDINAGRTVAGEYMSQDYLFHCFISRNGVATDLGAPGPDCVDRAINDAGQVAGYATVPGAGAEVGYYLGFIWQSGTFHWLGTLGGPQSQAEGINRHGHAAVSAQTPVGPDGLNHWHAAIYLNGPLQDLGTPRSRDSYATGINDRDEVIGYFFGNDQLPHPFLYSGGKLVKLDPLLGKYANKGLYPLSINAHGTIVAQDGAAHAYILEPVRH